MALTETATPTERLAAYRSKHLIDLEPVEHPEFGRIYRCAVDGLRVHATRNARWYHDPSELKGLLEAEYGGPWGNRLYVTPIVEPVESDDDEWTDRESQPEFNGSFR